MTAQARALNMQDVPDNMILMQYIGGNVGEVMWGGPGGAPSGRFYTFAASENGSVKYIDQRDVEWFLALRENKAQLFQIYAEPALAAPAPEEEKGKTIELSDPLTTLNSLELMKDDSKQDGVKPEDQVLLNTAPITAESEAAKLGSVAVGLDNPKPANVNDVAQNGEQAPSEAVKPDAINEAQVPVEVAQPDEEPKPASKPRKGK